jgi:rubrerythrin
LPSQCTWSLHIRISLKGTSTEKNLVVSFAEECIARKLDTYFLDVAKKQGAEQIAAVFLEDTRCSSTF